MLKLKKSLSLKGKRTKVFAFIIALAVTVAGVSLLRDSFANTTATCGRRISNYSYSVPWGNAIWNQPICGKPRHPQSPEYANRFLQWGHLNNGSPEFDVNNGKIYNNPGFPNPAQLDPLAGLFTREVYYASDATTSTQIQASVYFSNLDGIKPDWSPDFDKQKNLPDATIPWNPNWQTGKGGDNEIVILDNRIGPTQGRIYEISGYKSDLEAYTQCGPFFRDRICTYTVNVGRDTNGNIVDYRTYEGFINGRGVGLSMYATLTTPEEILAGEIRHTLGLSIPNTAVGPICTKAQLGTSAEGTTCGTAVSPATKFEHGGQSVPPMVANDPVLKQIYTQDKLIPEGMIFALDVTDSQIEAWINSRSDLVSNPRRAETARIFARAMRDYGMMIVDTGGSRPTIQTTGGVNPEAAKMWTDLGMGPEQRDNMLDGLINVNNLYVVDPPAAKCLDGTTSKYYCQWSSVSYGTTSSADTIAPAIKLNSPLNGASVSGVITVTSTATDNVGVTKVELFVDGVLQVSSTSAPYTMTLDTSKFTNGQHTITVRAYDAALNVSPPGSISVNIQNFTRKCDFNRDSITSAADLATLLANYNRLVTSKTNGDCNGDGRVTISDLAELLAEYGK